MVQIGRTVVALTHTQLQSNFLKVFTLGAEDHQIFENRPKMVEKKVETLQENSKMFRN